jgi:hypothetical protein
MVKNIYFMILIIYKWTKIAMLNVSNNQRVYKNN